MWLGNFLIYTGVGEVKSFKNLCDVDQLTRKFTHILDWPNSKQFINTFDLRFTTIPIRYKYIFATILNSDYNLVSFIYNTFSQC